MITIRSPVRTSHNIKQVSNTMILTALTMIATLCTTMVALMCVVFFFSSRRRHTRLQGDWSSDVCSSDLFWAQLVVLGVLAVTGAAFASDDRAPGDYACGLLLSLGAIALAFMQLKNRFDEIGRASCRERV